MKKKKKKDISFHSCQYSPCLEGRKADYHLCMCEIQPCLQYDCINRTLLKANCYFQTLNLNTDKFRDRYKINIALQVMQATF